MCDRPPVKDLVGVALRALSRLDVEGLEEMAERCKRLRCEMEERPREEWTEFVVEAREALQPLRNFARVLDATAANLDILANLSDLRAGRLEYGGRRSRV